MKLPKDIEFPNQDWFSARQRWNLVKLNRFIVRWLAAANTLNCGFEIYESWSHGHTAYRCEYTPARLEPAPVYPIPDGLIYDAKTPTYCGGGPPKLIPEKRQMCIVPASFFWPVPPEKLGYDEFALKRALY